MLCTLGEIYGFGRGVEKNRAKAERYFSRAVKKESTDALVYWADCTDCLNNEEKKQLNLKRYITAASKNNTLAMRRLARIWIFGFDSYNVYGDSKKNVYKGLELLADAADMGDVQAKVDFAYFMETGKYAEADVTYARQLVEEAARAGNAEANYRMYEAYAKGRYRVRRDEERARTYLYAAARGEFFDAIKELKQLAANGDAKAKEVYDSLEVK